MDGSCQRRVANGGREDLLLGRGFLQGSVLRAQQTIQLAKIRLTRHLNAPLIAVGTLIAVGMFRLRNNP